MSAPSYTYSLTNGSTADASQVMQNYNDILNGVSDGTKDLTINAFTCNGAVSLKGAVTLGDASGDDITVTGSLASTIAIKTTNTYNIGSATLGLAGVYFGTSSTQTARIVATGTLAAARTYTLLDAGAAANFVLSEAAATINGIKTFGDTTDASSSTVGGSVFSGGVAIAKKLYVGTSINFADYTKGIVGTATNDSAAASYIGERVSSAQGFVNFPTTAQYGDLTSISLTAGDWDVSAQGQAQVASATAMAATRFGISTTTGNSATGLTAGDTQIEIQPPTTTSNSSGAIACVRMSLTGTTTVYLKYYATYLTATPAAAGRLTARRVR